MHITNVILVALLVLLFATAQVDSTIESYSSSVSLKNDSAPLG